MKKSYAISKYWRTRELESELRFNALVKEEGRLVKS